MRYLSLFTGIGGFELGITRAYENLSRHPVSEVGTERKRLERQRDFLHPALGNEPSCIGYSEIDKYATQIYQRHFPDHKNYGDITQINETTLPDFDLLCGGFPCQAFSIAGKRAGFADTRGTLFFDIARILKEKRPRLLLLENVKGLLSHDSGRTFKVILSTLTELGYDLQWQVLNSKDFGVPQNRERVFIVGHLRGTRRPQVFPFTGADREDTRIIGQDVAYTIDANYHKGTNTLEKSRRSLVQLNQPTHSNDRVYDPEGIGPTLNTMQGGRRQPKVLFNKNPSGRGSNGRVFSTDGLAGTLTAGGDNPERNRDVGWNSGYYLDKTKIRRLTPTECERLQGFPDGWTEGVSDTQRYKTLGNAVSVPVIEAIVARLI